MSIYILLGLIIILILGKTLLKNLVNKDKINDTSLHYMLIDKFLVYSPQVYLLMLFTHWITDTGIDWLIVMVCYALILILWTVYGEIFFSKKFDSIAAVLVSLLTFLLLVIATAKSLYIVFFGTFMMYYMTLGFGSKRVKIIAKSIIIIIAIIILVSSISFHLNLEEEIKPIIIAKEYINVHHGKNSDYSYSIHALIFEINKPLYIIVWKDFNDDNRDVIELIYYKGQIYEHTGGTVNDSINEILDKERSDEKDDL